MALKDPISNTPPGPLYPIEPGADKMAIYELQQVTFGDAKLGNDGLMLRMKMAEKQLEELDNLRRSGRAFAAGLAVNLLFSALALFKLFGAL